MSIKNTVRKGDIVALAIVRSTTHAFGSGRGTERKTVYTLAVVESASRDGEANVLRRRHGVPMQRRRRDFHLQDVRTISGENQARALTLFDNFHWLEDEFERQEALKAAILAARGDDEQKNR